MKRLIVIFVFFGLLCVVPIRSHAQDSPPPQVIPLDRNVSDVVWSPDNRYIAFLGTDENYDTNVQVIEVSSEHLIADFDYDPREIVWSPDSTRLAVTADRDTGENRPWGTNPLMPVSILDIRTGEGQLIGMTVGINSLAWSPDGTQLAITTDEYMTSDAYRSTVQVWDAATGEIVAELDNGEAWIIMHYWHSSVWSPDGTYLAASNFSGDLAVWDVTRQEKVFEVWGFTENISHQIVWSPSGEWIAASDGNVVRTWNATTGEPISSFAGQTFSLRWVNDQQLARVEHDRVSLVDPISGRVSGTLESEQDSTLCRFSWQRCLVWSPDGSYAALVDNQAIQILPLTYVAAPDSPPVTLALVGPEAPLPALPDPTEPITAANASQITLLGQLGRDNISDVAWSPDGRTIALLGSHGVWLYDDPTLTQPPHLLSIDHGTLNRIAFSSDSRYLLLAVQNNDRRDYGIRVWDLASHTVARVLDGHTGPVRALDFSADGSLLATGSADYTIRLWDMNTGEQLRVLWDHVGDVLDVDFSPDGSLLTSAGDSMLRVWEVQTGDRIARYDGYTEYAKGDKYVFNARFAPDGNAVFFFHYNQLQTAVAVRRWFLDDDLRQPYSDAFSSVNFAGVGPRYAIAFSPDGSMMVVYALNGSYLHLLDVTTGEKIDGWWGLICALGSGAVAFSPDGQTLAMGVTDNLRCDSAPVSEPRTIWLWDVPTGQRRAVLRGLVAPVKSLIYSPDGSRLLAISTDGTVSLWDALTGELLQEVTDFHNPARYLRFDSAGTLHSLEIARDALVIRENGQPVNGVSRFNDLGANPFIEGAIPNADFSVIIARGFDFYDMSVNSRTYTLWNMATGERILPFPRELNSQTVTINPSGTRLASSKYGVQLWEIGAQTDPLILLENSALSIGGLTFSPDDHLLAGIVTPPGSAVKLWDLASGDQRSITLPATDAEILVLDFSPDSRYLVAQTRESGIWILSLEIDVEPVILLSDVQGPRHIAFSQDFSLLALTTDAEIQLWDPVTGTQITSFSASNIVSMAFNQEATLLAAGMGDGTTKLWGIR